MTSRKIKTDLSVLVIAIIAELLLAATVVKVATASTTTVQVRIWGRD